MPIKLAGDFVHLNLVLILEYNYTYHIIYVCVKAYALSFINGTYTGLGWDASISTPYMITIPRIPRLLYLYRYD